MANLLSSSKRVAAQRARRWQSMRPVRRRGASGLGDSLTAHGGIFQHESPYVSYETLNTSAYHDGSLGQDLEPELVSHVRRLTIVVGCTGLLVAGILLNQILSQARAR